MRLICRSMIVYLACACGGPGVVGDEQQPPSNQAGALPRFVAVDTSRLMGSPDPFPPMRFERAFPNLRFARPVMPIHAGDGTNRMFVVTQDGLIYVFPNRLDAKRSDVFLDIRAKVSRPGGDNGMFALAFHPTFSENGTFFVVYTTRAAPKSTVVSRLHVVKDDPNRADRDSEEVILRIRQPFADHNAACLAFGPDGMLYIALGDGGYNADNGNAQDRTTLLGSMLRINVDGREQDRSYTIPDDNPFASDKKWRGEIWAYGLRAPWRFSFDRVTGDCWLGDNGQVEFEEINLILPGRNYGWMPREGFHSYDPSRVDPRGRPADVSVPRREPELNRNDRFTDPIIEYDHTKGKSVVGGLVYRGHQLPSLIGAYVYGDYVNGNVWALRWDSKRVVEHKLIARTRLKITSFGEDQAGELYFTAFDGFTYSLRPASQSTGSNDFPTKLSQTGLFKSVRDLKPVDGMIPYSVNVPLWSDNSDKQRYLALPAAKKVVFHEHTSWQFPVGSVFVKTFFSPRPHSDHHPGKRLETRLLVHNARGWIGYTYRWNDEQTDALLLGGAAASSLPVKSDKRNSRQTWYFPSREDCMACHTRSSGFVLGMNTRQLNRSHEYNGTRENQLAMLDRLGVFSRNLNSPWKQLPAFPDWQTQTGTIEDRVRAYLDVNCAMCHTPPGFTKIDLRHQMSTEQMRLVGHDPEKPRLGPSDSKLVVPGDPARSELLLRMTRRGSGRMPNLATSLVDRQACNVVREWIQSLKSNRDEP